MREREREPIVQIDQPAGDPGRPRLRWLRFIVGLAVGALFVLPLYWVIVASLQPTGQALPSRLIWWPDQVTFANYRRIFELLPLARYALNSVIVVAIAVPVTLLTASWAGFAMTQLPARVRDMLIGLLVAALMVPLMAVWLSRFLVYKWLGLLDTLGVLIAPALLGSSPFYVLIMFWALRRIPRDGIDAARMDGAGAFRIWWSVALPQVRPALLAVTVLSFERHWSNFIDPLLYISNPDRYTLPVALLALQQLHRTQWPLLMAGVVVVTLPAVLVFLLAQRAFLSEAGERGGLHGEGSG